jgi:GNAT superfamily N-acetyltransferase
LTSGAIVRTVITSDVPSLMRLINDAYVVEKFFINGNRVTVDDITTRMAIPDSALLVAETLDPGELVGTVFARVSGMRGYFGLLAVSPRHQGKGLSRVLVNAAEQFCRAAGCEWLDIDVVDLREELPPFYRKFGFEVSGTSPFPDPQKLSQPAHLVTMSKQLRHPR